MDQFENLEAVSIYCPKCRQAMPVRKRLLLVLLDKEIYEYLCARCGSSIAKKDQPFGRPSTDPTVGGLPRGPNPGQRRLR
ncbi:MAG: hypothetical protein HYX72_01290 [Acidobacteria bacterium]|nr:hypothetical protein [Acidobacteriota bacterium]